MEKKFTLSGDELALAWFAAGHAIIYWKRAGRSAYHRGERMKFEALMKKLDAISDHAYPYHQPADDTIDLEHGKEPIMRLDAATVRKTRAAAKRFNRKYG